MGRYEIKQVLKEGFNVIMLVDNETASVAELIPEIGNNLFRFESRGFEVLKSPVSLGVLTSARFAPTEHGTPILFPPNRVKGGKFKFKDREYQLPINEIPDNHLHGEIGFRAWEVIETGVSDEQGAYVTSRFSYAACPEIMEYFPHELTFTVKYQLHEGELLLSGTITNNGIDEAPFALGFHPYFQIPFGNGAEVILKVPAEKEWPISNLSFVTGLPSATDYSRKLNEGVPIEDYPELGCTLLSMQEGDSTCRIEMKEQGYSIVYQFDRLFPYLLLFRPNWSASFSIEPYTYVTDAFNLPYDYELTGARGIAAGEEVKFETAMWIESKSI